MAEAVVEDTVTRVVDGVDAKDVLSDVVVVRASELVGATCVPAAVGWVDRNE